MTTTGHRKACRGASVAVAVVVAVVASALGFGAPVGAQQPPTLTLSEAEDLVPGQMVDAEITGGSQVTGLAGVTTCVAGASTLDHCDVGAATILSTPLPEPFLTHYRAVRHIVAVPLAGTEPELIDCAVAACEIILGNVAGTIYDAVPITVVDAPLPPTSVTLDPLGMYQSSSLAAVGLPPSRNVQIAGEACGSAASCTYRPITSATVAADGSLNASIFMPSDGDFLTACARGECRIVIRIVPLLQSPYLLAAVVPEVNFVDVAVTIDPFAVNDPAPSALDEIVASATITCDRPTFASAVATITQGGNEWSHQVEGGFCSDSEPLRVWLPSRTVVSTGAPVDPDSPVEVTVHASPLPTPVETVGATSTASVDLVDQTEVNTALVVALAGPDGAQIAQKIIDAIARRVAQDPVFAADFAAAIFG